MVIYVYYAYQRTWKPLNPILGETYEMVNHNEITFESEQLEQRYMQYHHQTQIVISSFQQAAGIGPAKTYTTLARQTISKQFQCLKDAIIGQIRVANKSLGEEDCLGGKMEGSSRLKFFDH